MHLWGDHPRRRRTDRQPNPGWVPTLVIVLSVMVADWVTKALVAANVEVGAFHEVVRGGVAIHHVKNPEMMLGLWGGFPLETRMVIAATAGILAILILLELVDRSHRLYPQHRVYSWMFTGLMVGGMFGNLGERALHWQVTDFLSLHAGGIWLPPGNVADLAMIAAMPLVLPIALFELKARRERRHFRQARSERRADPRAMPIAQPQGTTDG